MPGAATAVQALNERGVLAIVITSVAFARLEPAAPPVEAGKVRSDKGEFTFADATIKGTVKFGKFTFENPKVRFSDVIKKGNIGQDVLKDFAITIDIKQRRFRLEQTAEKPQK